MEGEAVTKQMEKLRDKLAEKYAIEEGEWNGLVNYEERAWKLGFDACYTEMAPLIGVLQWYANGTPKQISSMAKETLKKIGVKND